MKTSALFISLSLGAITIGTLQGMAPRALTDLPNAILQMEVQRSMEGLSRDDAFWHFTLEGVPITLASECELFRQAAWYLLSHGLLPKYHEQMERALKARAKKNKETQNNNTLLQS